MRKISSLRFAIVVSLALMMTLLPLSTLISTSAQEQTVQGPYPDKTQYPWPQFLHDNNHTSFSPGTGPKTNHVLWRFLTGESVRTNPSVVDGIVWVGEGYSGPIYALDAETGELLWSYDSGSMYSSMTVAAGALYSYGQGKVVALDAYTGELIWEFQEATVGPWWGPTFSNQRIVFAAGNNVVYSLTARTSVMKHSPPALYWTNNLTEYSGFAGMYGLLCNPAIVNGKIYVPSSDYYVYCLDEETGDIIWAYKTGEMIYTSASVVDGKVYVGGADTYFNCLDGETGAEIWRFKQESMTASSSAVAYGKVYFGSYDNNLYCLNKETGDLVWKYTTDGAVYSSPAVADGVVYAGSNDHFLYAFDAETGDLLWKYDCGYLQEAAAAPAVADGKLYMGSGVHYADWGQIICFGKGPTVIPLSLTASKLGLGESTIVSGSLLDQSPASPDAPVAGVPVVLGYVKDGASSELATVTTDSMGRFSYEWTPTAEGIYDLYASFAGDDSYEASMESIKIQVGPAPPEFPDVPTADEVAQEVIDQLPEYTTMSIVIAVAVIIAILIGLYSTWAIRRLRK